MVCRSVLEVQRNHFDHQSNFRHFPAKQWTIFGKIKKSEISQKNRFWSKIQSSIEKPIWTGMMIYGRKWLFEVFQMCFAPKIVILMHLEGILSDFEKIDFLNIFICGTSQNRACRIFYESRNFYMTLKKCLDISYLFPIYKRGGLTLHTF